jgi:hypothetical protein
LIVVPGIALHKSRPSSQSRLATDLQIYERAPRVKAHAE